MVENEANRKLRELAERIAKEEDAQKFSALIQELGLFLDSQNAACKPDRQKETLK